MAKSVTQKVEKAHRGFKRHQLKQKRLAHYTLTKNDPNATWLDVQVARYPRLAKTLVVLLVLSLVGALLYLAGVVLVTGASYLQENPEPLFKPVLVALGACLANSVTLALRSPLKKVPSASQD